MLLSFETHPMRYRVTKMVLLPDNRAVIRFADKYMEYDTTYHKNVCTHEEITPLSVWDLSTNTELFRLKNKKFANDFAVLRDGRLILAHNTYTKDPTCGYIEEQYIDVWDLETNACIHSFRAHNFSIQTVYSLWNNQLLTVAGDVFTNEYEIIVWDTETWEETLLLEDFSEPRPVTELYDGRIALGIGANIRILDLDDEAFDQTLEGHTPQVYNVFGRKYDMPLRGMAVLDGGKTLVSCSNDKTVRFWDVTTHTCTAILPCPAAVSFPHATPGGGFVCAGENNMLYVWEPSPKATAHTGGAGAGAAASASAPLSYTFTRSYRLCHCTSPICKHYVTNLSVHPDGRWIVTTSNKKIHILDDEEGRRSRIITRCKALKEDLMAAAWDPTNPRGEWLVLHELAHD